MLRASGIQTAATYIFLRQGTVAQWVDLRPVFEVYSREKGFKGGGRWIKTWWWQDALYELIRSTLEEEWIRQRRRYTPQGAT